MFDLFSGQGNDIGAVLSKIRLRRSRGRGHRDEDEDEP